MNFKDIKPFTRSSRYAVDVTWGYLEDWLAENERSCALELDPEFQRAHVWDDYKRSRYVEYMLRGGHSSKDIYFNCPNYVGGGGPTGVMQLVDGKQRLDAVRRWMRNEVPAFGILKDDMEGRMRTLTGPGFKVHVNDLQTHAEVLQWYCDINSGGVVHTEDELFKVRAMLWAEINGARAAERFWDKVNKHGLIRVEDLGPCWEWTGALSKGGYGNVTIKQKTMGTHTVSYAMHHPSLGSGEQVNHKCNFRGCVHPKHLYAGTKKQNSADREDWNTVPRGLNHKNTKLTDEQVSSIFEDSRTPTQLATIYGVSVSLVSMIQTGKHRKPETK